MPTALSAKLKADKAAGVTRMIRRRSTKNKRARAERIKSMVDKWNAKKESGKGKNEGGKSRTEKRANGK